VLLEEDELQAVQLESARAIVAIRNDPFTSIAGVPWAMTVGPLSARLRRSRSTAIDPLRAFTFARQRTECPRKRPKMLRKPCANSGRSPTAWPMGHIDPLPTFKVGPMNGRKARGKRTFPEGVGCAKIAFP
jgi:hypothetical protein